MEFSGAKGLLNGPAYLRLWKFVATLWAVAGSSFLPDNRHELFTHPPESEPQDIPDFSLAESFASAVP